MIKHIVMWKLKNKADAAEVKNRLEQLDGKIPSLLSIEVGIDFNQSDAASDVVLVTEFEDRQGLDDYQQHPDHQAVIPFMQSVTSGRTVVDYESAS